MRESERVARMVLTLVEAVAWDLGVTVMREAPDVARIRSVHPQLCSSEDMAQLPAEVERTFIRLWTHCDDEGRAKDNPRLVKAAIYPLHDDMTVEVVDEHLSFLEQRGHIVRYETEGDRFLEVIHWETYQRPQKKVPSKFPAPPSSDKVTTPKFGETSNPSPEDSDPAPVGALEDSGRATRQLPERYGPVVGVGEGEGVGEILAPAEPTRRRDDLWDAVMAASAVDPSSIPASARGAYNKAVKSLRDVGATASEVMARSAVYRRRWPDASLTPTALARRWAECDPNTQHAAPGRSNQNLGVLRRLAGGT